MAQNKKKSKGHKLIDNIYNELYGSGAFLSSRAADVTNAIGAYVHYKIKQERKKTKKLIAAAVEEALNKREDAKFEMQYEAEREQT